MQILNDFFEKIFVISIPRNNERLKEFFNNNKGLKVEVFNGIDGKELFPDIEYVQDFPKLFFEEKNILFNRAKNWNKGQLGCAMSNFNLQSYICKSNFKNALILEDDAVILKENLHFFEYAIKEIPENWELFYLGYHATSRWHKNNFQKLAVYLKNNIRPLKIEGKSSNMNNKMFSNVTFSKHLYVPGICIGTFGYALSSEGAKKLVELDTPLKFGFDTTLMEACYNSLISGYATKKKIVIPNTAFETSLTN